MTTVNRSRAQLLDSVASIYVTTSPIEKTKGVARDGSIHAALSTKRAHIANQALYQQGKTPTISTVQTFAPWVHIRANMAARTKTRSHVTTLARVRMAKNSLPTHLRVKTKPNALMKRKMNAAGKIYGVLLKSGEQSANVSRTKS